MAKYRRNPIVVEAITFDELVEYGKANGGNVVDGMPWSFQYQGQPVTHENDNCYLIVFIGETIKFERGDMLVTDEKGLTYPVTPRFFDKTYEAV